MSDIILYFIGAFDMLFNYTMPNWQSDNNMRIAFISCVGVMSGIVLWSLFQLVKSAISALFNSLRGD